MRNELKHCRWCGNERRFQVQLVIGGGAELVTDTLCVATDRKGMKCEAERISVGSKTLRKPRRRR